MISPLSGSVGWNRKMGPGGSELWPHLMRHDGLHGSEPRPWNGRAHHVVEVRVGARAGAGLRNRTSLARQLQFTVRQTAGRPSSTAYARPAPDLTPMRGGKQSCPGHRQHRTHILAGGEPQELAGVQNMSSTPTPTPSPGDKRACGPTKTQTGLSKGSNEEVAARAFTGNSGPPRTTTTHPPPGAIIAPRHQRHNTWGRL